MAALALAMLLTGAGPIGEGEQRRRPAPPPPIIMPAPVQPMPRIMPTPPPPPPARAPVPPQRARANLNSCFSTDDYPALAVAAREQGTVRFQLTIGPNGRVAACEVIASSGSAALDAAICRIIRERARYAPARAASGAAACDVFRGPVEWVLPPPRRRLPRDGPSPVVPPPIEDQLAPGACPGRTP